MGRTKGLADHDDDNALQPVKPPSRPTVSMMPYEFVGERKDDCVLKKKNPAKALAPTDSLDPVGPQTHVSSITQPSVVEELIPDPPSKEGSLDSWYPPPSSGVSMIPQAHVEELAPQHNPANEAKQKLEAQIATKIQEEYQRDHPDAMESEHSNNKPENSSPSRFSSSLILLLLLLLLVMGNLISLEQLFVHENYALEGSIPKEFGNLSDLQEFWFHRTELTGSVDSIFCDILSSAMPSSLWGDCMGSPPEIECTCCDRCCSADGDSCSLNAVSTTNPTANPTANPTVLPTPAPTTYSRRTYLLQTLGPQIAPNDSPAEWALFDDPTTPQAQALTWMSEEDLFSAQPESLSSLVLLERYALAVIYFSTSGSNWSSGTYFLDPVTSVCEWNDRVDSDDDFKGTYCVYDDGLVSHLILDALNIQQTIPWEVTLLQESLLHDATMAFTKPKRTKGLTDDDDDASRPISGRSPKPFLDRKPAAIDKDNMVNELDASTSEVVSVKELAAVDKENIENEKEASEPAKACSVEARATIPTSTMNATENANENANEKAKDGLFHTGATSPGAVPVTVSDHLETNIPKAQYDVHTTPSTSLDVNNVPGAIPVEGKKSLEVNDGPPSFGDVSQKSSAIGDKEDNKTVVTEGAIMDPVVAELAPDVDEVAARVAQQLEEQLASEWARLRQEAQKSQPQVGVLVQGISIPEGESTVSPGEGQKSLENEKDDGYICGLKTRTCGILVVLLLVVGGAVGGALAAVLSGGRGGDPVAYTDVVTVAPTSAPTPEMTLKASISPGAVQVMEDDTEFQLSNSTPVPSSSSSVADPPTSPRRPGAVDVRSSPCSKKSKELKAVQGQVSPPSPIMETQNPEIIRQSSEHQLTPEKDSLQTSLPSSIPFPVPQPSSPGAHSTRHEKHISPKKNHKLRLSEPSSAPLPFESSSPGVSRKTRSKKKGKFSMIDSISSVPTSSRDLQGDDDIESQKHLNDTSQNVSPAQAATPQVDAELVPNNDDVAARVTDQLGKQMVSQWQDRINEVVQSQLKEQRQKDVIVDAVAVEKESLPRLRFYVLAGLCLLVAGGIIGG
eukprot:Nitzschia sp. Nitz4//scaffold324_size20210//12723//19246//NITZ4_008699-RA/size20210-processed-gene-0.1-mRNA-1//1//CDS//3329547889//6520//frame0